MSTARGALILGLALGCFSGARAAERLSAERQREILRASLHAFDQAVAIAREDPPRAADHYRQARAGLEALSAAGVRNAALEYNLGNVCFRLDDLGRAVLHYRRAEWLGGGDERLAANLRYARERVEPRIAPSGQTRLTRQLLFWHYNTTPRARFWALVACGIVGWPLLFAWLRYRRRPLLAAGLVAVALGLAAAASLSWQLDDEARQPHAVIVVKELRLRLGRGEGTDLALKEPLGAGVEVRVLQQRGDWVEVRLPNDQTGWLPADALERV